MSTSNPCGDLGQAGPWSSPEPLHAGTSALGLPSPGRCSSASRALSMHPEAHVLIGPFYRWQNGGAGRGNPARTGLHSRGCPQAEGGAALTFAPASQRPQTRRLAPEPQPLPSPRSRVPSGRAGPSCTGPLRTQPPSHPARSSARWVRRAAAGNSGLAGRGPEAEDMGEPRQAGPPGQTPSPGGPQAEPPPAPHLPTSSPAAKPPCLTPGLPNLAASQRLLPWRATGRPQDPRGIRLPVPPNHQAQGFAQ